VIAAIGVCIRYLLELLNGALGLLTGEINARKHNMREEQPGVAGHGDGRSFFGVVVIVPVFQDVRIDGIGFRIARREFQRTI